jgi:acetyl-CoA carboxylase biotin carboxyl carrier protein
MADKNKKPVKAPVAGVASTSFDVVAASTSFDVEALRQIVELLEASEVSSLDWRRGPERLSIRRGPPPPHVVHAAALAQGPGVHVTSQAVAPASGSPVAGPRPSAPRPAVPVEPRDEKKGHVITSPFVGTFYRSPSPDQASFVEVGGAVKKGQVLCIIEAMKLMNEIEAEVSGKVSEVLAQNGQPVEFGQPLFRIEA